MTDKEPVKPETHSDLAKFLYVIAQEIGSINPQAFKEIDILKAIQQADRCGLLSSRDKNSLRMVAKL